MKKSYWLLISVLVIVLDQITKYWIAGQFLPYQSIEIFPFFNITLAFNTGAAFSFLHHSGQWHQWFFMIFTTLMSGLLLFFIYKTPRFFYVQLVGLTLILGGALGNLIDRISIGHVIDFIDLHYRVYHWPVFNIADIAICVGAGLLLMRQMSFNGARSPKG